MSLKSDINADIRETFLNWGEFAESRVVSGRVIACVFYAGSDSNGDDMGTAESTHVLHAETSDIPRTVKQGKQIAIDGKVFDVLSICDDYGIATLKLSIRQ